MTTSSKIAVVIPCFRVSGHILSILNKIGSEVHSIYVVDDACPDHSGQFVLDHNLDARVRVLFNKKNQGVGGATICGYQQAFADGHDVIVKIDGDGQMDPSILNKFIEPILLGRADFTKGNRFYNLSDLKSMPTIRLIGNALLTFMSKFSTGYWNIFDPTNGYIAINAKLIPLLSLEKIDKRYFFESDLLFRLGIVRALVKDIPMRSVYSEEISNLKIRKVIIPFFLKHAKNFLKRIFYNYLLRDFSVAFLELIFGTGFFLFGALFGVYAWHSSESLSHFASSGTVMLSALPVILGVQFLLSFVNFDISNVPSSSIADLLSDR